MIWTYYSRWSRGFVPVLPLRLDPSDLAELLVDPHGVAESLRLVGIFITTLFWAGMVMAFLLSISKVFLRLIVCWPRLTWCERWLFLQAGAATWSIRTLLVVETRRVCVWFQFVLVEHAFLPGHFLHSYSLELVFEVSWNWNGLFLVFGRLDYSRSWNWRLHLQTALHFGETLTFGTIVYLAVLRVIVTNWRPPPLIFGSED